MTIEKRVQNGASLLDAKYVGWIDKIDLDRLDMRDCKNCILGQLYGSYDIGSDALDMGLFDDSFDEEAKERRDHGFTLLLDRETFGELTSAWKKFITERRNAMPAVAEPAGQLSSAG